jgi:hypothetical protein
VVPLIWPAKKSPAIAFVSSDVLSARGAREVRALQAPDRVHELVLSVVWKAGRDPVGIKLGDGEAFGLQKNLVRGFVREAGDLVLDRRAVARPHAFDDAREQRRAIERAADDVVSARVGMRDPARQLPRVFLAAAEKRKYRRRLVARLLGHDREIDRAPVQPRRCAGLEPPDRKLELPQLARQRERGRLARAAGAVLLEPDVNQPAQESAGGEHDRSRPKLDAGLRHDAGDAAAFEQQVVHGLLEDGKARLMLQPTSNRVAIEDAIGLRARRAHCGTLARIEDAKLDARLVRRRRHGAVERVDFLHQVAFADATDRWIARHLTEGFHAVRHKEGLATHPGSRQRRLGAGMATPYNNNIIYINMLH